MKKLYRNMSAKELRQMYRRKRLFGGNAEKVFARDEYKCVVCKMTNEQHVEIFGVHISIDHIDGNGRYSDTPNHAFDNLQTLCMRCHGRKDGFHPTDKLSDDDVSEIRALYASGGMTQKTIAKKFMIHRTYAGKIIRNKRRN